MTGGFSTLHIALTAGLTGVLVAAAGAALRLSARQVALVTGLAIVAVLGWRLAANVPALNDDGMPWVSANDVLTGGAVYLVLRMYDDLARHGDPRTLARLRVAAAVAAVIVNVIVI